jgi:hypothetical protein
MSVGTLSTRVVVAGKTLHCRCVQLNGRRSLLAFHSIRSINDLFFHAAIEKEKRNAPLFIRKVGSLWVNRGLYKRVARRTIQRICMLPNDSEPKSPNVAAAEENKRKD